MRLLIFILFILPTACTTSPIYHTKTVKIKPSPLLLEPLPIPSFTGTTNEDLLLHTLALEQNLSLCNARLEAIKKSTSNE